ncbi:circularly permuted type 2 ATP-grasp protein [Demequina sp. B12]|uniref:circularly permuted type 2 ATP-grasp protein n=1 Tax=Demequina sp. B12 TaxID=2992757 RepID=UPI00237A89EC|nr:circularly permuted type 2 ATP-grasp protein [Demequina sp. B12]MDE0572829.1 circularly permuted type 2 ATP-grasp protein [Demequina sp. B12]
MDLDGEVREPYARVYEEIERMSRDDLRSRAEALASTYLAQGVTFDHAGEERPFPLDIVPRVVGADEWDIISPGVAQRVRTLEAFLADVYGSQRCVTDGVVPRRLIATSQYFYRAVAGVEPANGVRVHVSGIDLVRDQHGIWRVLEDNVRVPSGVSYVLSNRRAMSQMFPELFGAMGIRPVLEYSRRLRSALARSAPEGVHDPTIVVLTPGVYNSAYYEHSLLARTMGVELVEGRDLETVNGHVFMRTTAGRRRVDVIYRRVDDEFLDPVKFRPDSVLGAPGLIHAARLGNVTIANAIGNGVADDKLIYTYMPDLTRYYLGEEPVLPNVDTWRLEEDEAREEVLDRLDELVVKPVDGAGGKGVLIGTRASRDELAAARAQILADPRGWIAQPVVQLSTVPTLTESGLEPRHVDLRPFAINDGEEPWVLPGGLTRVALQRGQLIVNSSQGGGSKDTWVLGGVRQRPHGEPPVESRVELAGLASVPQSAHPEDVVAGQQQQQQQQQQHEVGGTSGGGAPC